MDLSRAFLDTNGAHQEADVTLTVPNREGTPFERKEVGDVKEVDEDVRLLKCLLPEGTGGAV